LDFSFAKCILNFPEKLKIIELTISIRANAFLYLLDKEENPAYNVMLVGGRQGVRVGKAKNQIKTRKV
jgi:hypothetical protein